MTGVTSGFGAGQPADWTISKMSGGPRSADSPNPSRLLLRTIGMTPQSLARPFTAVAVAVTLTVAACGGDDSSSGSSSTIRPAAVTTAVDASTAQPVGQSPAQTVDQPVVVIARSRFGTPELRVAVGTTVVFENTDEYAHTVSSADDSPIAFGSEELGQGDTFSITFDTPGVYSYYCMIHPTMRGAVIVE